LYFATTCGIGSLSSTSDQQIPIYQAIPAAKPGNRSLARFRLAMPFQKRGSSGWNAIRKVPSRISVRIMTLTYASGRNMLPARHQRTESAAAGWMLLQPQAYQEMQFCLGREHGLPCVQCRFALHVVWAGVRQRHRHAGMVIPAWSLPRHLYCLRNSMNKVKKT